jgi:alpha-galactosidase
VAELAATPPLGWNSWNQWQSAVDQDKVLAAAKALKRHGLQALGYDTVVIDDCWSEPKRDSAGALVPHKERFSEGIAALAREVHGLGLKLGIYSCAAEKTCAGYLGSLGHEDQDAKLWASWGIDYLKYDYCNAPIDQAAAIERYTRMGQALRACGRDMVYSICEWGGRAPHLWGRQAGGQMWRVSGDLFDSWVDVWVAPPGYYGVGVGSAFDLAADLAPYGGPGGWNDLDMLVIGLKGKGAVHGGGLSLMEYRTHLTLWILACSPLMLGCDLDKLGGEELDWLKNEGALAVNQDALGVPARRVLRQGACEAWAKPLADGRMAVGLFNRGEAGADLDLSAAALGLLDAPKAVRDLWGRRDDGELAVKRSWRLQPHEGLLMTVKDR